MYIQEAIKEVMESGGYMKRKGERQCFMKIVPVNIRLPFEWEIKSPSNEIQKGRNWNPTPEELLADDWEVIKE